MINYPTIVVENFFDNPDSVVELTTKLDFFPAKERENWPGFRSKNLLITNKKLFEFICKKFVELYFNFCSDESAFDYEDVEILFHKFNYKDEKEIKGLIHTDQRQLAGVIYLNKGVTDEDTGTSIYDKDNKRIVKVSNNYNTLVAYDGKRNHGATGFNDKERLTIVIFFKRLKLTP